MKSSGYFGLRFQAFRLRGMKTNGYILQGYLRMQSIRKYWGAWGEGLDCFHFLIEFSLS